ncbi:Kynurenine--oxoglutarate transaminase 3 [Hypsibius exemplaris]|uniref:Kynurenine--oxoglutarate transaminase 3 n=1 Tax=Hypsibius exemplaris TaxID=2072580 RepID=A0A1W0WKX6_HYPEX|nr:Kynurenine--oxoglutarate transaminase 3 [Hypsibius exemplaris]
MLRPALRLPPPLCPAICAATVRPSSSSSADCLLQTASALATFPPFRTAKTMALDAAKTSSSVKVDLSDRLKGLDKNVWVEYTGLAAKHKAVNLGQGFPDFPPPAYVTKALAEATNGANHLLNQYTRGYGHPRLVNVMAEVFSKIHNRPIDPNNEILVTIGAYQSLFCAITGFINPGDEVIVIEPFFDCYEPMIRYAGGTPVFVPLHPPKTKTDGMTKSADWTLDMRELEDHFTSKTRMIILNTPNNPLGKVFTKKELDAIAEICVRKNILVVSDEVYEWLIFQPNEHIRIADLPGMWERTITVRSAGKTFSVTGWKLGWAIGPANLILNCRVMLQNVSYTSPTPIQEAVAVGFEIEKDRIGSKECYFQELPEMLVEKRDRMAEMLQKAGFIPILPEGGYFMLADYSKLKNMPELPKSDEAADSVFVKWMIAEKKLATIPVSAFYSQGHKHLAEEYIRFCFSKNDSTLDAADKILTDWMRQ